MYSTYQNLKFLSQASKWREIQVFFVEIVKLYYFYYKTSSVYSDLNK